MNTSKKFLLITIIVSLEIFITASFFKISEYALGAGFVYISLLSLFIGGMWASGEFKD